MSAHHSCVVRVDEFLSFLAFCRQEKKKQSAMNLGEQRRVWKSASVTRCHSCVDLCGHHRGSRSLADPNARACVMGVAEVREAQGFPRPVLVTGARSDAIPIDFRSGNRFAAVADRDGEVNIPGFARTAGFDECETPQSQEGC